MAAMSSNDAAKYTIFKYPSYFSIVSPFQMLCTVIGLKRLT